MRCDKNALNLNMKGQFDSLPAHMQRWFRETGLGAMPCLLSPVHGHQLSILQ